MTTPPFPSDIFAPGDVLNNTHEILGVLGRGGTGEVYLARNQVTERKVAIKALNAQFSGQSEYIELMKREEQMRSIFDDAVVRYWECSRSTDGHVFLVMDYIEGPSLNELMLEGRIDEHDLLIVAHRVLEGLRATHAQGIVHRDLSPDNIILRGGRPDKATIIDFGIAKDTATGARTIVGKQFAGKYEYAAPEQLDGNADTTADFYALGASLLAAARREVPDVGTSPGEVVRFKARTLDSTGLGAPLKELVDWLCAPDPLQRPQSAQEVLTRLDGWLKPSELAPPRRSRKGLVLAGVLGALVLGGLGAWLSGALDGLGTSPLPQAAPYRLAAMHGSGESVLSGNAPDEAAAEALRAAFAQATGEAPPADGLTLAIGLPFETWPDEIAALLARLAPLNSFELAVTDSSAHLTGLAPDLASRDALRTALATPGGALSLSTDLVAGPRTLPASAIAPLLGHLSDCGPLAQLDGDATSYALFDTITLTGDVSSEAVNTALGDALTPVIGDRSLRLETRVLNPDLCAIRAALPQVAPGPLSIWLGRGASGEAALTGVFRTGDNPVAEIQLPATIDGTLWVMVVDNTGKVFHLLPNVNAGETQVSRLGSIEAGLRRIRVLWPIEALSEDPTRLAVEVTEGDYGKSEIVAILSSEPLFDMRRPRDESVAALAEALAEDLPGREDVILGLASRIIDARP
ncbi:protein kinase [Citreicella sp. C3M06]|uniref:serine/threonine protein kinase n=1 Tax=Citreicella sp. C3M06 TaxID=2841564 RepID=UPI001C0A3B04|nr:serine/threonine protein kinase [Citreicella sp. C3M06]MBU2959863.1 protein kinase [Citreicella sp. C3M06]